jgi:hypothetical protein
LAERVQALLESALKFIGSHQVSAFAACSVTAWPEGSRISRSRRATSRHYGRVPTGSDLPILDVG